MVTILRFMRSHKLSYTFSLIYALGSTIPVLAQEPISATALRYPATARELTVPTYLVTRADMQAAGALTVGDALKLVPGLFIIDDLGGVMSMGSVRGLPFTVLLDGRPYGLDLARESTLNLERIEVVTGGGTVRYGTGASSALINLITRTPAGPPKLNLLTSQGSYGQSQYAANYTYGNSLPASDPGYVAFELGYEQRSILNNYLQKVTVAPPAGGTLSIFDYSTLQLFTGLRRPYTFTNLAFGQYAFNDYYYGKLTFKPGKSHRVTLSTQQQNTRRGNSSGRVSCFTRSITLPNTSCSNRVGPFGPTLIGVFFSPTTGYGYGGLPPASGGSPYDFKEDTTHVNLSWDWDLSELNKLTTEVTYRHSFNDFTATSLFTSTDRVFDAQVRYVGELYPGNRLSSGIQFFTDRRVQQFESLWFLTPGAAPLPTLTTLDRETSRSSAYLAEDLKFFDDTLLLNLGGRLTTTPLTGAYASAEAGFRYNFGGPRGQEPLGWRGNWRQDFTASRNVSYDVGLDVALSPTASLQATYYRSDTNALGIAVVQLGSRVLAPLEIASLATGWEFLFNWKFDPQWRMIASQTFTDARMTGVDSGGQDLIFSPSTFGYQLFNVPNYQTGLRFQYETSGFNAALSGYLIGERSLSQSGAIGTSLPSYNRWDLTTRVPLGNIFTFTASVFNIFGTPYERSGSLGNPTPGTTFNLGLEASF